MALTLLGSAQILVYQTTVPGIGFLNCPRNLISLQENSHLAGLSVMLAAATNFKTAVGVMFFLGLSVDQNVINKANHTFKAL